MISALRKIEGRGETGERQLRVMECASTIRARALPIFCDASSVDKRIAAVDQVRRRP